MNKQRYLAELGQLLIFMTGADRDLTLHRFGDLFDQAGPGGAEALVARIGSPTKNAIRLSRSYMPGCLTDEILFQGLDLTAPEPEASPAPEPAAKAAEPEEAPAPAPEKEAHPAYVLPDLPDLTEMPDLPDLPDLPDIPAAAGEPVPAEPEPEEPEEAEAEEAPEPDKTEDEGPEEAAGPDEEETPPAPEEPPVDDASPAPGVKVPHGFVSVPLHPMEEPDEEPEREKPQVERPMPLWAGVPLFILAVVILCLPLAALILALLPVLLLPGAAVLGGAALAAVGGLWCIAYVADAVLLFGLAFFVLGLGLLVLWCGFALDVDLVKLYIKIVAGLKHLFLGRRVS